jgi:hypothetical protein
MDTFVEDETIKSYVPEPKRCAAEVGTDGKLKSRGDQCHYCKRHENIFRNVNGKNTRPVYCHTENGIARVVAGSHSFGQVFTEGTRENICYDCVFEEITANTVAGESPPYTKDNYADHMGHLVNGEGWCANSAIASILFYFLLCGYDFTNAHVKSALITGRIQKGNLREWMKNPGSTLPEIEN